MAKIAKRIIWWAAVTGASSYRIRIIPNGVDFSYVATYKEVAVPAADEHEFDLAEFGDIPEGVYNIYITAVDEVGNESDPLVLADAVLDFQAPSAPSSGGFR